MTSNFLKGARVKKDIKLPTQLETKKHLEDDKGLLSNFIDDCIINSRDSYNAMNISESSISTILDSWEYLERTPAYGFAYYNNVLDLVAIIYKYKVKIFFNRGFDGKYAASFRESVILDRGGE